MVGIKGRYVVEKVQGCRWRLGKVVNTGVVWGGHGYSIGSSCNIGSEWSNDSDSRCRCRGVLFLRDWSGSTCNIREWGVQVVFNQGYIRGSGYC